MGLRYGNLKALEGLCLVIVVAKIKHSVYLYLFMRCKDKTVEDNLKVYYYFSIFF